MLGIVILNYNSWYETYKCIKSIIATTNLDYTIYVVDNFSNDWNEEIINKIVNTSNCTLIYNKKNLGYNGGNNVGISYALHDKCNAVLVSNPDIIYQPASIDLMYAFLMKSDYAIVCPKILDLNKKIQCLHTNRKLKYSDLYFMFTEFKIFSKRLDKYYGVEKDYQNDREIYGVSGCSFMIKSCVMKEIYPLDENVFLYYEEAILATRLDELKYKSFYLSSANVIHEHGVTTQKVKPFSLREAAKSELYYFKKYLKISNFKMFPIIIYRFIVYLIKIRSVNDYLFNVKVYIKEIKNIIRSKCEK